MLRLAAVDAAKQPAQQDEVGAFMVARRVAQRDVERGPSLGELGFVVGVGGAEGFEHLLADRIAVLGLVELQAPEAGLLFERLAGDGEALDG